MPQVYPKAFEWCIVNVLHIFIVLEIIVHAYLNKCHKSILPALIENILECTTQLKFFLLVYFERSAMLILGH